MGEKSYLKNQIRLMSLNACDLFTDREHEIFMEVCDLVHEIDRLEEEDNSDPKLKKDLIARRKERSARLSEEIAKHNGIPRKVRIKSILHQEKGQPLDAGVTWKALKFSKKINEFESEMSRAMGLHHLDQTFDKIILKWKNEDVLRQLVLDGFTMDILNEDGTIATKKYQYLTSSAG